MVPDIIVYGSLGVSAATLVLLIVFFLRVGALITKKVAEIAAKIEQTGGGILAGVTELASRTQAPPPSPPSPPPTVEAPPQPVPGITMEAGLGGQVGPAGGVPATTTPAPEALQPGKRYKYVMDPVTRKMKLVPAD